MTEKKLSFYEIFNCYRSTAGAGVLPEKSQIKVPMIMTMIIHPMMNNNDVDDDYIE